jgi:hypothetical protein
VKRGPSHADEEAQSAMTEAPSVGGTAISTVAGGKKRRHGVLAIGASLTVQFTAPSHGPGRVRRINLSEADFTRGVTSFGPGGQELGVYLGSISKRECSGPRSRYGRGGDQPEPGAESGETTPKKSEATNLCMGEEFSQ